MSINQKIMTLLARTPVHVGADNSVGAIDSPVMRERHTRIPIIPGSSIKGVISDLWNDQLEGKDRPKNTDLRTLFGSNSDSEASAGQLMFGEAKVLAFPVRSAKGSFAWVTCPLALQRFERDAGVELDIPEVFENEKCYGSEDVLLGNGKIILEEYCFESENLCEDIADKLSGLSNEKIWNTVKSRLVIVSDEMFSYFVEQACQVVTRTRIDDEKGVVDNGALFNHEQVPSETMFYAVIGALDKTGHPAGDAFSKLAGKVDKQILQFGGNETIGLGFCSVQIH
jgi:CRISPR-associated protein Cmr4